MAKADCDYSSTQRRKKMFVFAETSDVVENLMYMHVRVNIRHLWKMKNSFG